MNKVLTKSLTAVAVAAVFGTAVAQAPATGEGRPAAYSAREASNKGSAVSSADKAFVEKATQGGMAEVALGKLASEKAASDDVKSYGKKLISDHSKANEELKSIAGRKNMALPSDMSSSQRKTEERLEKLSGASFDREYMKGMVKDHEDTVKLFEKEAKSGKDADLKAFAEKTLPTLKDHLTHARQIAKSRTRPANRRREQGVDA
jgi:putative membrane protein